MSPPVTVGRLFGMWDMAPFPLAAMVVELALAGWYVRAMRELRRRGRVWPWRRLVAFLSGLAAVAVALQSSVAVYVMTHFPAHITQHLLLMIVAPVLLALAAPVTLVLQWADRGLRRRLQRFLESRLLHVVTFPVVVFTLYYAVMWAFFTTPLIAIAMDHMWLMDLLNLSFLAGGILFWWPIAGLDPILHWKLSYGGKLLSLAIGIPFEAFLGIALTSQSVSPFRGYSLSSWTDGAQVLWGASEMLTTAAAGLVMYQWMRHSTRSDLRLQRSSATAPLASRSDGRVPEVFWAERTLATMRPGSPLYVQAQAILDRVQREGRPEGPSSATAPPRAEQVIGAEPQSRAEPA
jgi:putative membrane protein